MRSDDQGTEQGPVGYPSRLMLYLLGWFVALMGWWLLLVDSLFFAEVLAGLAATILAILVIVGVRRKSDVRFRPRLRWLRWLRPIPAGVLRDSAVLAAVLWRRLIRRERPHSAFRTVRFPACDTDLESAAWRAFSTLWLRGLSWESCPIWARESKRRHFILRINRPTLRLSWGVLPRARPR